MFKNLEYLDKSSWRVFDLLAEAPSREFYEREIAKKTKLSVGATNNVLKKLVNEEMVSRSRKGNMVFFKLNMTNPLVRILRVCLIVKIIEPLISDLKKISKRAVLFGSSARGDWTKESDIDLFIITDQKINGVLKEHQQKIKKSIKPVTVSTKELPTFRKNNKAFYERAMRGFVLWSEDGLRV